MILVNDEQLAEIRKIFGVGITTTRVAKNHKKVEGYHDWEIPATALYVGYTRDEMLNRDVEVRRFDVHQQSNGLHAVQFACYLPGTDTGWMMCLDWIDDPRLDRILGRTTELPEPSAKATIAGATIVLGALALLKHRTAKKAKKQEEIRKFEQLTVEEPVEATR